MPRCTRESLRGFKKRMRIPRPHPRPTIWRSEPRMKVQADRVAGASWSTAGGVSLHPRGEEGGTLWGPLIHDGATRMTQSLPQGLASRSQHPEIGWDVTCEFGGASIRPTAPGDCNVQPHLRVLFWSQPPRVLAPRRTQHPCPCGLERSPLNDSQRPRPVTGMGPSETTYHVGLPWRVDAQRRHPLLSGH